MLVRNNNNTNLFSLINETDKNFANRIKFRAAAHELFAKYFILYSAWVEKYYNQRIIMYFMVAQDNIA